MNLDRQGQRLGDDEVLGAVTPLLGLCDVVDELSGGPSLEHPGDERIDLGLSAQHGAGAGDVGHLAEAHVRIPHQLGDDRALALQPRPGFLRVSEQEAESNDGCCQR